MGQACLVREQGLPVICTRARYQKVSSNARERAFEPRRHEVWLTSPQARSPTCQPNVDGRILPDLLSGDKSRFTTTLTSKGSSFLYPRSPRSWLAAHAVRLGRNQGRLNSVRWVPPSGTGGRPTITTPRCCVCVVRRCRDGFHGPTKILQENSTTAASER